MLTRAKVALFDLASPSAIWGLDGYSTASVVVRSGARPLGILQVDVLGRDGISAAHMRQLALDEFVVTPDASEPEEPPLPVTVVVCTRNRPRSLRQCLQAIADLDHPDYEGIVVDNGSSTGETEAVIRATRFRYVREERVGLNHARNRGWSEAGHALVAYVDDDAVVDQLWLRQMARTFADPAVAGVTGLVLPYELDFLPQVIFEAYGGMSKGFRTRDFVPARMSPSALIAAHRVGVGANMAFRRTVLEELGGFDPALDVGTVSSGAGDLDMFHRVLAAGLIMRYEPAALVWHQHRRDMRALRRQVHDNGRSFGVYLGKIWATRSVPRQAVLRYAAIEWCAGWLLRRAWRSIVTRPGSPGAVFAWTELVGVLTAPWAYWRTYATASPRGAGQGDVVPSEAERR
jgi:glycosyltransferase involved in cell wall biosynthesis